MSPRDILSAVPQSGSRALARRLVDSHRSASAGGDTDARAAAAACNELYKELSRWVGPDGCHALFTRALAEAQIEYPGLGQIKLRAREEPYIDGLAETIMALGDNVTAEAIESMLARLVELLGRLIGDDMAMTLIERGLVAAERGDPASNGRREA